MPKLDKNKAKKVKENESSFPLLDEGIYYATLKDVKVAPQPGPAGDYWVWEFQDLVNQETGEAASGRQWLNTSLSDSAEWKLNETFEAFGVDPGTDTDELLGSDCRILVTQREIEKGNRKGEMGNQIERVLPLGEDEGEPEPVAAPVRKAAARSKK